MKSLLLILNSLCSLFFLTCLAKQEIITGKVDRKSLPLQFADTQIIVNGGQQSCLVDNMGNFKVAVPGPGTYRLDVLNMDFHFEPVVVEVYPEEFQPGKNTKAFLYSTKTGKDYRLLYPLQLDPSGILRYFELKPPFNPMAYLKNPFVIMIGMTALLSCLTKSVDKDEYKKAQGMQADAMKDMPQQC